jgi:hypothetical protein
VQVSELEKGIAFNLRASWQARVLSAAEGRGLGMVALSVLAHNFDEAMPVLLAIVYPGFRSIKAPFLCSAGKVDKAGRVVADMVTADGRIIKEAPLYPSETALRDTFRKLADRLKLSDSDRIELFKCVQRWVVADRRLDPTFDPMDPDAKRLVLN